ncbi:MAG: glycosyltransferase [Verrucomicrobia bacterium]|nr:glycosyltransferase [Verrucomicrobiota bacterium]
MRIHLYSLHGLFRGQNLEIGRDADNGGQIIYVMELARALSERPEVTHVHLFTRRMDDPAVGPDYAVPIEHLSDKFDIRRIPCGGRKYLPKEQLWDHLDEYVTNVVTHIKSEKIFPDWIHSHYADAGYVGRELLRCSTCRSLIPAIRSANPNSKAPRRRPPRGRSHGTVPLPAPLRGRGWDPRQRRVRRHLHRPRGPQLLGLCQRQPCRIPCPPPASTSPATTPSSRTSPPVPRRPSSAATTVFVIRDSLEKFFLPPGTPHHPRHLSPRPEEEHRRPHPRLWHRPRAAGHCQPRRLRRHPRGHRCHAPRREGGAHRDPPPDGQVQPLRAARDPQETRCPRPGPRDLPALRPEKGVFVNMALTEPFGLTLLEASACGLPIVATSNGGPAEIVRRCENGLLADPHDLAAVQKAIKQVLTDPELWLRLSETGVRKVREHYSWERHVERYLKLVQDNRHVSQGLGRKNLALNPKLHERLKLADRMILTDIDGT